MQTVALSRAERLRRLFLYFLLYSIIGWCYEVFLEVVVYRWGYSDRGVLFGPYCPVYGVGALTFLLLIDPLIRGRSVKRRLALLPVVFLGCGLVATAIELAASYLCEWTMGSWPWQTYVDYAVNFQGRIALSPSIRFGLGGVLFLYVLQPLFEKLVAAIPDRSRKLVFTICAAVFAVDLVAFVIVRLL